MDASIIIVNYNGLTVLNDCLTSLRGLGDSEAYEIILVDNASDDGSAPFVKKAFSNVAVIANSTNVGFGRACNIGAEQAKGRYLLFLNPDTGANDDFISTLVDFLDQHPEAGIVGPKITYDNGTLQLSCGKLPSIVTEAFDKLKYSLARRARSTVQRWLERTHATPRKVEWVTGAALMVRAEVFRSLSGFDTTMFMYFEDKDLCKRVHEQGWEVWYLPTTSVRHLLGSSSLHSSATRLRGIYRASQRHYYSKHHGVVQQWLLSLYQGLSR